MTVHTFLNKAIEHALKGETEQVRWYMEKYVEAFNNCGPSSQFNEGHFVKTLSCLLSGVENPDDLSLDGQIPSDEAVIKWLSDVHDIHVSIYKEVIGTDEWEFAFRIQYIPHEFREAKRRMPHLKTIESYFEYGSNYVGAWDKREEAIKEAVKKAMSLIK